MSALCVEKWVKHSTGEEGMECHHMLSICTHVKKKKNKNIVFLLFPRECDVCVWFHY